MFAKDIMTTTVVSVTTQQSVAEVARVMAARRISAVPVLDAQGHVVGMCSEGDLVPQEMLHEEHQEGKRDWWLMMLAEGEALPSAYLSVLKHDEYMPVQAVMHAPVITVQPLTPIVEIANLLMEYHIKRVPVVQEERLIGIVSRADVLHALAHMCEHFAGAQVRERVGGSLEFSPLHVRLEQLKARVRALVHHEPAEVAANSVTVSLEQAPDAREFDALVKEAVQQRKAVAQAAKQHEAARHLHKVEELQQCFLDDALWQRMVQMAKDAALRGERESCLLSFPCDLCSDGGRAIHVAEEGWPSTLRGEAVQVYLRWRKELKPHGFTLSARVTRYEDGKPYDIGMFLGWPAGV